MARVTEKQRTVLLKRQKQLQRDYANAFNAAMDEIRQARPQYADSPLLSFVVHRYCAMVQDWDERSLPDDAVTFADRQWEQHGWLANNVSITGRADDVGLRAVAKVLTSLRTRTREWEGVR